MKTFLPKQITGFLCILLCATPSIAEDLSVFTGWKQSHTNHFRFIYEDSFQLQAEGFAQIADTAWNSISEIYSTPQEMTDVLITGRTDTVNAYAETLSLFMCFYTTPPLSPEFGYRENWQTLFFTHELTHIANFTFEDKKHPLSDFFGPYWNAFNFSTIPSWSFEGLTTVLETELTKGGRGRSPFFELYYKAPTLENSFLHFNEIGQEASPPQGQAYVMGYLLMRSIADRYGIQAIADIERNRTIGRDFSESVQLVTGNSPEELFQDVRIALSKKYALERSIPEGKTITPRTLNSYYYRPALISDAGIIMLRDREGKDRAAVRYNPVTAEETILFEGNFADELSLTAGENGALIAALTSERMDRMPGYSVSTDLYRWSEQTGLIQLTKGKSLFQPTLSRDGKKLVAVELEGKHYRLVEVSLETGKRTVLLESESESFIQPSLSKDGSQLAFLILDDTRAILASAPMPQYEFAYPIPKAIITKRANDTGAIMDIAYPSWTSEGELLFASNERGRLEVWSVLDGKKTPVVSDPVGAFWADKTKEGICYASYAGTGNVLKIKPVSQWGVVPSFSGPSIPGQIITLGNLVSDFAAFKPYQREEKKDTENETGLKRVEKKRSTEIQTELQNESPFYNIPHLQLWMPTISYIGSPNDETIFGAGALAAFSGYPLQNGLQSTSFLVGGTWYPSIGQADAFLVSSIPVFTGKLGLYGVRQNTYDAGAQKFVESSMGLASFSVPIYNRIFYRDRIDLAFVTGFQGMAARKSTAVFSSSDTLPYNTGITGSAGIDIYYKKMLEENLILTTKASSAFLISTFPSISTTSYLSGELHAFAAVGTKAVQGEAGIRSRWFDLPSDAPIPGTLVTPKGENLDCLYPMRSIMQVSIVIPNETNTRVFLEKLVSFGSNSVDMATPDNASWNNMLIDRNWYTGVELEGEAGRSRIAFGVVCRFTDTSSFNFVKNSRIYLTVKLDALQGTIQ